MASTKENSKLMARGKSVLCVLMLNFSIAIQGLSQADVSFSVERNFLSGGFVLNDSTTVSSARTTSFSPVLGLHVAIINHQPLVVQGGLSVGHFRESFKIENTLGLGLEIHEFFRFGVPITAKFELGQIYLVAAVLPTLNLKSVYSYEYSWLEESFRSFSFGASVAIEKKFSKRWLGGLYFKHYLIPMYNEERFSFFEYGYGAAIVYRIVAKK